MEFRMTINIWDSHINLCEIIATKNNIDILFVTFSKNSKVDVGVKASSKLEMNDFIEEINLEFNDNIQGI